jgi:DNA modification methylase
VTPYYEDDHVTIYHGDCREILPLLPVADLILTDPPYGLGDLWAGGGGETTMILSPIRAEMICR